jgi:hypothetical protein
VDISNRDSILAFRAYIAGQFAEFVTVLTDFRSVLEVEMFEIDPSIRYQAHQFLGVRWKQLFLPR